MCQVILPNFVAVASNLIPQLCEFWGYVLASKEALSVVHLYNYTLYKIHNQQLCDLLHHLKKNLNAFFATFRKLLTLFLMNFSTGGLQIAFKVAITAEFIVYGVMNMK